MSRLPKPRDRPCRECPWRRASFPGFLGPYDADEWADLLRSDEPIACHTTMREHEAREDGTVPWSQPGLRQCAGSARTRANMAKLPRDPDVAVGPRDDACFGNAGEFLDHHQSEGSD